MLACSVGLPYGAGAQTDTMKAIETDTIDLFSNPAAEAGRSPLFAMLSSLVLPGSGHHYLERNRSAMVFISTEAAAVFGFFFCRHYARGLAHDAAGYAWIHAGAQGSIHSADDDFWKQVGSYMDVQDYNTVIDLNRLGQGERQKFTDETRFWRWDDESSKDRFNALLSSSRVFSMVSSFCIGALVLNRIVAFIDTRTTTRNYGTKQTGSAAPHSVTFRPVILISSFSVDLRIAGNF